jgi:uncharacterized membrane protein
MNPHGPFDGGPGFHGGEESMFSILPFLGGFILLVILLLALTTFLLWRHGKLPAFGSRRPEDEAKRILAERFAGGDISTDEFLERSSILNWTPGVDPSPSKRRKMSR